MKKSTSGVLAGVMGMVIGAVGGAIASGKVSNNIIEQNTKKVDKFRSYYEVLNQWLMLKQEGKQLESFFEKNKYQTIAIYGMGELGNRLSKELEGSSIHVKYYLDKVAACTDSEQNIIDLEDDLEPIDAVIVTAIFAFDEIEEFMSSKVECPIISLEEVVFNV